MKKQPVPLKVAGHVAGELSVLILKKKGDYLFDLLRSLASDIGATAPKKKRPGQKRTECCKLEAELIKLGCADLNGAITALEAAARLRTDRHDCGEKD